jgi:UDP-N-acetylmuramoyl-L-alanyl-D-glutamate--2,6-diaminopimelate ligase
MKLKNVLQEIEYSTWDNLRQIEIQGLSCDSKNIHNDYIFVAVKGNKLDGHQFIDEAISRGAKVIISQHDFSLPKGVNKILVKDTRLTLPKLASNFFGHPAQKLKIIGVTGTNGKTTITYLINDILIRAGFKTGLIGTVQYRLNDRVIPSTNTTPGPIELQSFLKEMLSHGLEYAVIEVSSHSLDQHRIDEIYFDAAIFTNLTLDHLDYHGNFENYFLAKAKLFEKLKPAGKAIINIDDKYGVRFKKIVKNNPFFSYGLSEKADIYAQDIKLSLEGSEISLVTLYGSFELKTKLIGLHNVYNILAATGAAMAQGVNLDIIQEALSQSEGAPGRLQPIKEGQPFKVFVDYAHSDDALKNVLTALNKIKKRNILLLFGCGGERDRSKRPLMAKVASELADWVIITSDNPRGEDPEAIIEEIERGLPDNFENYFKIVDREKAIEKIITMAKKDDIILIAGKGHENYQIFKDRVIPFNDREAARKYIKQLYPHSVLAIW